MNREYLEDYEKEELGEHEELRRLLISGKFGSTDIFPPKQRFIKIAEPIALFAGGVAETNLWPQVPLAGSTFVMIYPVREDVFKKAHGFEISDIDRIIDFIKETGKIQFLIDWPLTAFEGLDFLDPIFAELRPPTYPWPLELFSTLSQVHRREAIVEFDTLADIHFHDLIKTVYSKDAVHDRLLIAKRMHDYRMDFLALKELGLDDLSEKIGNLMVDDPPAAYQAFTVIAAFITLPLYNPLRATLNYDLDLFAQAKENIKVENPSFPCEIGKFLMTELIYYPESLTACQELIADYEDHDLQKLVAALNEGIKRTDFDLVKATREDLSETLKNIWKDRSIPRKIGGLEVGIPISLAALGAIALGPIGAVGGLLGGLGYSVGSEILKIGTDKLGEKIAKMLSQSYQVNIYNFKKKYKLR